MYGTEKLRQLIYLIFGYKREQCPRCYYFGEFPTGTHYDENNNYSDWGLLICPICNKIF